MAGFRIVGAGPAHAAVGGALTGLGWQQAESATLGLAILSPAPQDGEPGVVAVIESLASDLLKDAPACTYDAGGEIRAAVQLVLLLDRATLVPGVAPGSAQVATAAGLAWMRDATVRLAPQLRVNAVALDLRDPGDLTAILRWLTRTEAVAGQLVTLGALPRPRCSPAVVPMSTATG